MLEDLWGTTTEQHAVFRPSKSSAGWMGNGALSRRSVTSSSRPTAGCSVPCVSIATPTTRGVFPGRESLLSGLERWGSTSLQRPAWRRCSRFASSTDRAVTDTLYELSDHELTEVRTAPDEPGHPSGEHSVLQSLHVLFNEEWEHHRYAVRDLDALGRG